MISGLDVIRRLLEERFPGRDELIAQLEGLQVELSDDAGGLFLKASCGGPAPVEHPVPVEATYPDRDGVGVHVLLHVVKGYIDELQVFREDGGRVQIPAYEAPLEVLVNDLHSDGFSDS